MGRTRRILLSDTLLADYSDDEIEVVLAHELSHHVHHDLWRGDRGCRRCCSSAASSSRTSRCARSADPLGAARHRRSGRRCRCCCWPAASARSCSCRWPTRSRARRSGAPIATRSRLTRNPEAFISAMKRLSQQNLAEEHPSRLVQWLFYSHPPIRERIDAARRFTTDVARPVRCCASGDLHRFAVARLACSSLVMSAPSVARNRRARSTSPIAARRPTRPSTRWRRTGSRSSRAPTSSSRIWRSPRTAC